MPDQSNDKPKPPTGAQDDRSRLLQALRLIDRLQKRDRERSGPGTDEPIAIIGTGCRFPGGVQDPESFWRLLSDGVDATGPFPPDRGDPDALYDEDPDAPGKAYVMRGGFLDGPVDRFEPAVFGISPREAVGMDPQQRLTLEVAWEALERAGYAPDSLEGSPTGVFLGVSTTDYVRLRQEQGDIRDVDAYQLVGEPSFMAGRISYTLGLTGPSQVVDTACSSSLVALHDACQALRLGECDMALAGGVNLVLAPYGMVLMSKFRALSPDGRCKTFDASADGYGRGEGAGIVVLKRLADAQAAGDNILALVRGTAVNHDGRSSGLTVPNPDAQQAVIKAALTAARIEPADIGYIEAHGTGTSLGDPIELRALEAVIGRHHEGRSPLMVGSVKTNIGHLESAAGIAGLIKLVLSLQHGEIPQHLNFRTPNPNIDWDRLHIKVATAHTPWPSDTRLRAGAISGFGASGTNAHAVLSEAPAVKAPAEPPRPRRWNVATLSARTDTALQKSAVRYADHLRDHPDASLADLCYTTHVGRARQSHGLAVAADGAEGLEAALRAFAAGQRPPAATTTTLPPHRNRKVAWLFTGQGSQRVGMAAGLRDEPVFREAFDRCAAHLDPGLDRPLHTVVWPEDGEASPIDDTRYTQPALFALEYALAQVWTSMGVRPSALLGHSIGEIVAACVAGVLSLEDAAKLVAARSRLMAELPSGGAMASLACDEHTAAQAIAACGGTVAIAGVNGPEEVVVSGAAADVDAITERLAAEGVRARRLAVSHAFHSPLIEPMLDEFRTVLDGLSYSAPRIPLVSNVTGRLWTADEVGPEYWVRHAAGAVLFRDGIRVLHADGIRTFLELGPVPVLCGLGERSLDDPDAVFVPTLRKNAEDEQALVQAAGVVALRGTKVDWAAFHAAEQARRTDLPTTPWNGETYWYQPLDPSNAAASPAASGEEVPGLGRRLNGAVPTYELPLDDEQWSAAAVHTDAGGRRFLSPGTLADTVLAAARDGLGGTWRSVSDLTAHELPPLDPATGAQRIQLVVTAGEDGHASYELRGTTAGGVRAGAPWRLLSHGTLHRRGTTGRLTAELADRPALDPASYAEPLTAEAAGLPADLVEGIASGDGGVLLTLSATAEHGWAGVIDAAAIAVGRAAADGEEAQDGTLAELADLGCVDPARVRQVRARAEADGDAVVGTAEFFDADGVALGGVHGLRLVPAAGRTAVPEPWRDPAELVYQVEWHEAEGVADGRAAEFAGRGILLVADTGGLADRLAEQLRETGAEVTVAAAPVTGTGRDATPDAGALAELVDSWTAATESPSRIVVLTGLDAPDLAETGGTELDEFAARADLLVIDLVRQLADRPDRADIRVAMVTRGAMPADPGQSRHDPVANTLWGLGRVLALEHAEQWGGLVDLEPDPADGEPARLADALALGTTEDQQALRGTRRLVARLVASPPTPAQLRTRVRIREDGTYLITGAFGGIGLQLAHWLAQAGAGKLVLLGRTPLPERSTWDGELPDAVRPRVDAVLSLERLGVEVAVESCDVTDEAAMTEIFGRLAQDTARPLRGVVHAAGISAPQFVRDVDADEYRRVWRPKVVGGWLVHRLSADAPLELFLGFSSIAATWGSQHLASYSAANAFLDGLAHHRAAAGLPALAVDWGPWAQDSNLFGDEVMAFLKSTGLRPLAAPQCIELLGSMLAGDVPQQVVCAADWAVYKTIMEARTDRPMLATIVVDDTQADGGESTDLVEALLGTADRAELVSDYLRGVLSEVVGVGPETIEPTADVMRYGLDSLMVMDVVQRCKRNLGLAIKASHLFERTTFEEWTDLLVTEFGRAHDDAVEGDGGSAADTEQDGPSDPAWLARDVVLDPAIVPSGPARSASAPQHVVLTGATGFIGAYLLAELLESTEATVAALVRCNGTEDGLRRIRENLTQYLPWPDGAEDRIEILPGDLGLPRLGLTEEDFAALAARTEAIYHNGAWVNFSYTYEQLRAANLTGTEEILRLACQEKPIPVHYVSTYGIWGIPADGCTVIREDDDISGAGRLVTGYVQTKWAAEHLALAARERGIPVNMYRPGRVLGDSRTGACLTTHFTTRVIKGCVQLGIAPEIDLEIEMTPVDYVAGALVGISLLDQPLGGTYHLVNARKMHFRELIDALRQRGWAVESVPVERWWQTLRDSYGEQPNELHPVMGVVEEFVVGGEEAVHYDVTNAEKALADTGVACPPLDRGLLDLYLDWMIGSGYLPQPE